VTKDFKFITVSILLSLCVIYFFYNQNNSSKTPPQSTYTQTNKSDQELFDAINLLKKEVFSLREEIKNIEAELRSLTPKNFLDDQTLIEISAAENNFNPYDSDETIKPFHRTATDAENKTYNESQKQAFELLQNTDIFESIPDVNE
tara:strand:- start:1336 stop:1773 length:438 start_codon:yes stop_codon:yes gene_type:complete